MGTGPPLSVFISTVLSAGLPVCLYLTPCRYRGKLLDDTETHLVNSTENAKAVAAKAKQQYKQGNWNLCHTCIIVLTVTVVFAFMLVYIRVSGTALGILLGAVAALQGRGLHSCPLADCLTEQMICTRDGTRSAHLRVTANLLMGCKIRDDGNRMIGLPSSSQRSTIHKTCAWAELHVTYSKHVISFLPLLLLLLL